MLINNDSITLMPKVLNQLAGNLGYYKDLQTHQNHSINLLETFMLICFQKIKFITHFFLKILPRNYVFLEILQRHCKLVLLGTLGMFGQAHPKWYYQFIENFRVYLQAKNQLHLHIFSGDIVKICKLILDTLGMLGNTHSKMIVPTWRRLQYLSTC